MDAQIYQLESMRSLSSSRMSTEPYCPMQLTSDGLALMLAAMSFWVEYVAAMALFHHQAVLGGCLPFSKPPKEWGGQ